MDQTIRLDAKKREGSFCKERIYPLRRGERNNVTLTVAVRRDRRPYDLAGMTAHLVWQAADGKLVGPVPMEVADTAAGTVRCTLPNACYAAVGTARAYIELRRGAELVDTTDEMSIEVLDCIDAEGEQAEEYKPLIAEVREATDAAIKAAAKAVTDTQAAIAEVKATEAKLYPAAENILVGSETGAVVHVDDAFAGASLRKITVEGACRQDGTPSPDNPVPIQVIENPTLKVTGADTSSVSTSLAFTLPSEHPYLAKLPDGMADTIEVDRDGNIGLVARVGMNRDVRKVGDFQQGQYYSLEVGLRPFASPNEDYGRPVLCSALPSRRTTSNNEGIYRTWNGVYVQDTSGRTKEEIQAEVDKNAPLTVVAPIPETRYQLGKIEMPKAQDSIVNVWTDAEVIPNTGIGYVRDVNIVVANLESAIASITQS